MSDWDAVSTPVAAADPWDAVSTRVQTVPAPTQEDPRWTGALERARTNPKPAGTLDLVAQGLTFGFGDEIASGVGAGLETLASPLTGDNRGFTQRYYDELARTREGLRQYRDQNPVRAIGSEVAGGVMSVMGAPAAKGAQAIASGLPSVTDRVLRAVGLGQTQAPNALNNAARAVGVGTVQGGVQGFGSGEGGFGQRLQNSGEQALIGGATAGVLSGAMSVAGPPARYIYNQVEARVNPERRAVDMVGESLRRDRTSADEVANAIMRAQQAGDDTFVAADAAGRNTRNLAGQAVRRPGEGASRGEEFLRQRQTGSATGASSQADRIDDALAPGLGRASARGSLDDLAARRQAESVPLYEQAYRTPIQTDQVLDEVGRRGSVVAARAKLQDIASERNIPASEVLNPDGTPTMRGWDFIKRQLDADVNRLYNAGQGIEAEGVKETRNLLRDHLRQVNPTYGQALDSFSDISTLREAVENGANLIRSTQRVDFEDLINRFNAASPREQELWRTGALDAIRSSPQRRTPTNNAAPRVEGSGTNAEAQKLRALFPDQQSYDQFVAAAEREGRKFQTFGQIRGSETAERAAGAADVNANAGLVNSIMGGDPRGAVRSFVANVLSPRNAGMTEDVADRVVDIILNPRFAQEYGPALQGFTERAQRGLQRNDELMQAVNAAGQAVLSGGRSGEAALPPNQTARQRIQSQSERPDSFAAALRRLTGY